MGGSLPARRRKAAPLEVPPLSAFEAQLKGTRRTRDLDDHGVRAHSEHDHPRQEDRQAAWCPSCPTKSRTFGMEGMFRQLGIYSHVGQLYTPQDAEQLMYYKEDKNGQILEEGINEAGAMSSWIAAATAYSTHGSR